MKIIIDRPDECVRGGWRVEIGGLRDDCLGDGEMLEVVIAAMRGPGCEIPYLKSEQQWIEHKERLAAIGRWADDQKPTEKTP
jgi:hypothetical protein